MSSALTELNSDGVIESFHESFTLSAIVRTTWSLILSFRIRQTSVRIQTEMDPAGLCKRVNEQTGNDCIDFSVSSMSPRVFCSFCRQIKQRWYPSRQQAEAKRTVEVGAFPVGDSLFPFHSMFTLPPHLFLAVWGDHVGPQRLAVFVEIPILRHVGVQGGQTQVAKPAVTAVRTACW